MNKFIEKLRGAPPPVVHVPKSPSDYDNKPDPNDRIMSGNLGSKVFAIKLFSTGSQS